MVSLNIPVDYDNLQSLIHKTNIQQDIQAGTEI